MTPEYTCSAPDHEDGGTTVVRAMRPRWAAESYAQRLNDDPEDGETIRVRVVGQDGEEQVFDVVAEVHDPTWRAREVKP